MKTGLLFLTATLLLQSDALCAPSYVRTIVADHRWSIGNDSVERIISFSSDQGLRTDALTYKITGRDFLDFSRSQKHYGEEIAVRANQQQITGRSLRLVGADSVDIAGGKILRLRTTTQDGLLAIAVNYGVYDDAPGIRKWIGITNQSTQAISLSNISFESLAAAPGTPADLEVNGGYGTVPRELFFTGRVSDPAVVLRNAFTGEGLAILNEAPGYLKRTEIGEGWGERFRVMYDTDLFPFRRTLQPHETFESAKCSLVFFADGHGFEDSHWAVPGYVARHVMRRPGESGPPWIFNTWEPFLRGINAMTVGELAPVAEQMGLNIFTIDDGWQAEYGSNEIDPKNFPGGFSQIHSMLEKNHLKLGLWVPLAAISTKSADYQTHPEWACRDQNGNRKFTSTASGTSAVMCLASGYRDSALKRLEDLITRYRPAYIKVDLTTVFNAYGEAPGCYARNHAHRDWAESLTLIYQGLEYIGQQLYRDHPEVLVDYTFELWGEKHVIDPALLECADLDWLSNVDDQQPEYGGPLHARTLLYQRALSIPAETMLIGNMRAPTGSIEEHFATAIGSAPLFLGDLRKLSDADRQWYGEKIRWYQQLRSRASLSDSFFPLGNWQQPEASAWDGFARFSRESDGIVALFKNTSDAATGMVRIEAPADANYEVRSIITGSSLGKVSAAELAKGWQIPFPANHSVEILELRRVGR
jgi:alpha-galactosidase